MTIEDIILKHDRRGMRYLRPYLQARYTRDAARIILENPGTVIIVTGFYILGAEADETDGPPGAVAIGNSLQTLGYKVIYVTDQHGAPLMQALVDKGQRVISYPIANEDTSRKFADKILKETNPSVIISIERCGLTAENDYRNMRGLDISGFNARADYLFANHGVTIGIGDGGNEIGMGNLADIIPTIQNLPKVPCITTTTALIIASVSNWGGYGLVTAISELQNINLLPSMEQGSEYLIKAAEAGAVDGMSAKQEPKVDGFSLSEDSQIIQELHAYLSEKGIHG